MPKSNNNNEAEDPGMFDSNEVDHNAILDVLRKKRGIKINIKGDCEVQISIDTPDDQNE